MPSNDENFTGKNDANQKYKSAYPNEIIKILHDKYGFNEEMMVADIGCDKEILADLFLENGNQVICVDPDPNRLSIAKKKLASYKKIAFVNGKAESTTLQDHTVNVISTGQAFRWFDTDKARREFKRILKAPNLVVIVWNERDSRDPFAAQYDEIVREFSKERSKTGSTNIPVERIYSFFNYEYDYYQPDNTQSLDLDSLMNRYLVSTYGLTENDPKYKDAISRLRDIFNTNQKNGKITIKYTTKVFIGTLM
ncbi:MAG: class I SAM-dependent methyltransferase [Thermoplasmata archaeon]